MGIALERLGADGCAGVASRLVSITQTKGGGYDLWAPCPVHPDNSPSWHYQADRDQFYCFGCGDHGDLIDLYCRLHSLNEKDGFLQFCKEFCPDVLEGGQGVRPVRPAAGVPAQQPRRWQPQESGDPAQLWVEKATAFLVDCQKNLGASQMDLLKSWGISDQTARACRMGWNAEDKYPTVKSWGQPHRVSPKSGKEARIWLPQGLVIPFFRTGVLQKLKIRRSDDSMKAAPNLTQRYWEVVGGSSSVYVYGKPDARVVVVVETERDAALIWQEGKHFGVTAIGLGGASKRPDVVALKTLRNADVILNALDNDFAGMNQLLTWWKGEFPNQIEWPIPQVYGKDVGDAVKDHGFDVRAWLEEGIPAHVKKELARARQVPAHPQLMVSEEQQKERASLSELQLNNDPLGVRKLKYLMEQCRKVYARANTDGLGAAGCDGCRKWNRQFHMGCELWSEIGILVCNDNQVLEFVEKSGGKFGPIGR